MFKTLICNLFHRKIWEQIFCDRDENENPVPRLRGDYCYKCDAVRNVEDSPALRMEN